LYIAAPAGRETAAAATTLAKNIVPKDFIEAPWVLFGIVLRDSRPSHAVCITAAPGGSLVSAVFPRKLLGEAQIAFR
jgi:hypothetical protein